MAFTYILVPTDFSAPANRALGYALAEATLHHARVTLLHVLPAHTGTDVYLIGGAQGVVRSGFEPELSSRLGTPIAPEPRVIRHDHYEDALTQLHDLMPASFSGPWDAEVATGTPAETIVHIAHAHGADLIVMATHGRTGLQHVLLGSVAEKVVRLATCPVLTIRASNAPEVP